MTGLLSLPQQSYIPSNSAVDPENHMMYAMDGSAGKIAGLKYNPVTGNMSVALRLLAEERF